MSSNLQSPVLQFVSENGFLRSTDLKVNTHNGFRWLSMCDANYQIINAWLATFEIACDPTQLSGSKVITFATSAIFETLALKTASKKEMSSGYLLAS